MDVELAERELELERSWLLAKRKLERRPKAEREHGKENAEEKAEEEKRMLLPQNHLNQVKKTPPLPPPPPRV